MTDDFDLGSAADWVLALRGTDDVPARMATSTMKTLVRVAADGPRSTDEAAAILDDPRQRELLQEMWADIPPTPEVRERLLADPVGRSLLELAPEPAQQETGGAVVQLRSWLASARMAPVPAPTALAASSATSLPLVQTYAVPGTDLTLEARGDAQEFALVVDGTNQPENVVAVVVELAEGRTTYLLPLVDVPDREPVAIVRSPYPQDVAVTALATGTGVGDVLAALAEDRELAEAVVRSVRAADGATLEAWRLLARDAGRDTALYDAVVEGLR